MNHAYPVNTQGVLSSVGLCRATTPDTVVTSAQRLFVKIGELTASRIVGGLKGRLRQ